MTPFRQQMTAALELNGKSLATIDAYVREVYLVAKFYAKRPDLISEAEPPLGGGFCFSEVSGRRRRPL